MAFSKFAETYKINGSYVMVDTGQAIARPFTSSPSDSTTYTRYKWTALLGVTFCYLFYYTGRQTFGFAIPGIQQELGLSKEALGWISAAMLWAYALGQSVNGNLGDKWGGRLMMALGAILSFAANWATSFAMGFLTLLLAWGINGYFQSMGFAPGSRLISNWWGHEKRGFVYGFYIGVASFSSVIAYILPLVILNYLGLDWRWIFRLSVFLLLVGAVVMYVTVREKPEDLGLVGPSDDLSPTTKNDGVQLDHSTSRARYKAVLSNWKLYATGISIGFQNAARYALIVWVPVHFLGPHWKASADLVDPRWITLALPIGMAIGAITNSWISDLVFASRRYLAIITYMVAAAVVAMIMYLLPTGSAWGIVTLFLCGFLVFGPASSFWALCPDIFGRRLSGTATGCLNFISYAFAGFGEPIIGRMMDITGQTSLIFPLVTGLCLMSATCALMIRR